MRLVINNIATGIASLQQAEYTHRYRDSLIPEYARFKKKFADNTANSLTQAILTFLKLSDCHAERVNTMGRPVDQTKVVSNCLGQRQRIGSISWIPGGGTKGSADIHSVIRGRFTAIEVKAGRDRQSDYQKQYQESIEKSGGQYWLVHSFKDFLKYFYLT